LRVRSRAPVLAAIGVTLLILALAIGQTIVSQRAARAQADAGVEALLALHQVLQASLDAETGQRGFLLTGQEVYLEPYNSARPRIDSSLHSLETALRASNGAEGAQGLAGLSALVNQRMAILDQTIALARAGQREEALSLVKSNRGKQLMDAIRARVASLGADEERTRSAAFVRASRLERTVVPLMAVLGAITLGLVFLALRAEQRRSAAEAEAAQADALRAANERANLLANELNHRVKNLFSTILSIVSLSARKQAATQEVVEDIRERILALSRAHIVSQGSDGDEMVDVGTVIANTLQPYADGDGGRVTLAGPQIKVPARTVTPLGLIVHELATNAAKYGALCADEGKVEVSWELVTHAEGPRVALIWRETGGPHPGLDGGPPSGSGFGSRMIALATQQLGGTLERQWPASGAVAQIEFPVS
jgi:two-component sensor histidine kinase/CHASE3 domain sensor protein